MAKQFITEAEYQVMKILWNSNTPLALGDILKLLSENEWSRNTVSTLLTRLCEKGIVGYNQKGKIYFYYAITQEQDYNLTETKSLLKKLYHGSIGNLVACLYENKALSKEEIAHLKAIINQEEE